MSTYSCFWIFTILYTNIMCPVYQIRTIFSDSRSRISYYRSWILLVKSSKHSYINIWQCWSLIKCSWFKLIRHLFKSHMRLPRNVNLCFDVREQWLKHIEKATVYSELVVHTHTLAHRKVSNTFSNIQISIVLGINDLLIPKCSKKTLLFTI